MKWSEPVPVEVSPEIRLAVGGHPLVAQTLVRRGLNDPLAARAYLDPQAYSPANPFDLTDMAVAVERLQRALQAGEKVLVWGDFDVDGQTSTTLLVSALRALGGQVSYYIPDRTLESHGLHAAKLATFLDRGAQVVLTCDTGITAQAAAELAAQRGVDILVTDHHDLPAVLPPFRAAVNPHRLPAGHPLAGLPGVGVAYQLVAALFRQANRQVDLPEFLDLVALGIIVDLAELTGDTRYLLQVGMLALRQTRRPGLLAILERLELEPAGLTGENVGFLIGPRLNALGRLGDANLAVELLTTPSLSRARVIALQLETLNAERRFMTSSIFQAVLAEIRTNPALLEPPVLVVHNPKWPAGVIGIVASRLVDTFQKPVALISTENGSQGRGSARSVPGVSISAALEAVGDLLTAFGGHPMAAGFALPSESIPEFKRRLNQAVLQARPQPEPVLMIDGVLPFSQLSIDLVADLDRLAPFGPGNPALTLVAPQSTIKTSSFLGREEEHLLLKIEESPTGFVQRVIWWQGAGWPLPSNSFDLAYRVSVSVYKGRQELQVEWVGFQQLGQEAVELKPVDRLPKIVDYRQEPHPLTLLKMMFGQKEFQIWAEGEDVKKLVGGGLNAFPRDRLVPCDTLVIWTSPPSPLIWQDVLTAVKPNRIILIGLSPPAVEAQAFLQRLAGLVKYVLRRENSAVSESSAGGRVSLAHLAGATAQKESTVRLGLDWLTASGFVSILADDGAEVTLGSGGTHTPMQVENITPQIKNSLAETSAFRAYLRRATLEEINTLIQPPQSKTKKGEA